MAWLRPVITSGVTRIRDLFDKYGDAIDTAHAALDGRLSQESLNSNYVTSSTYSIPAARGVMGQGLSPIASRYGKFEFSGQSNGTDLTTNSMLRYEPHKDASSVVATYYNPSTVAVTVSGSIGTASAAVRQITFNGGSSTAVIAPKQWLRSDSIPLPFFLSALFFVRTFMSVSSGVWCFTHVGAESSEAIERGPALTDKTMTGTITNGGGGSFGPVAVCYEMGPSDPLVSALGDSITGASGSTGTLANGFVRRAFNGKTSFVVAQRGGESARAVVTNTDVGSSPHTDPLPASNSRYALFSAGNWSTNNHGINDIRLGGTVAQLQADVITIARRAVAQGQVHVLFTLLPNTSSTDGWATTGNQTANATILAKLIQENQWRRAGCPINPSTFAPLTPGTAGAIIAGQVGHPIYKVIDITPAVETVQDSGIWKAPGFTTDGLHPNDAGHEAVAQIVRDAMSADPHLFGKTVRIPSAVTV